MAIENVTVKLMSGATIVATTTTNISGEYSFADVSCGTYKLVFEKSGYITKEISGIVITDANNTITSTCIQTPCSGGIEGTIQVDDGVNPVAVAEGGTIVFVHQSLGGSYNAIIDSFGYYILSNLPCGTYKPHLIYGDPGAIYTDSLDEIEVTRGITSVFNKTYDIFPIS